MKLYSYVVSRDYGFAPNPFGQYCTLATCKPKIRERSDIGDWVVGTGSKSVGLRDSLVYTMKITKKITFDQYWNDPRFSYKRPLMNGSLKQTYGDNIYHLDKNQQAWIQENSHHSLENGIPNSLNVERDLQSKYVLISDYFWYFGENAAPLPNQLCDQIRKNGQGYKCHFPEGLIDEFITWIEGLFPPGYYGNPRQFTSFERYLGR